MWLVSKHAPHVPLTVNEVISTLGVQKIHRAATVGGELRAKKRMKQHRRRGNEGRVGRKAHDPPGRPGGRS